MFSDPDIGMAWQRALHKKGWGAPGWPVEHGGPDWTPAQRWIFEAECARAGVPQCQCDGRQDGRPRHHRLRLARAEEFLSAAHSLRRGLLVPGLFRARLRLRSRLAEDPRGARRRRLHHQRHQDLDHACPSRQPHVRAGAHQRHAERQQDGISFILIDMKSPGITTRPILTIGGDHEVNQVFFDDVRVPVANRVGEEGKGWTYGKYLLEFERGAGIASAKLREALKTVSDLANPTSPAAPSTIPILRVRMSEIEVDIDTLEMTELRVLSALQTGQNPGAVSSLLKLRVSEIRQAVTRLGVEVIGNDGLYVEPMRPFYKLNEEPAIPEEMLPVVPEYLNGRAYTIFGGSSEIQRDIVAKMVLGL